MVTEGEETEDLRTPGNINERRLFGQTGMSVEGSVRGCGQGCARPPSDRPFRPDGFRPPRETCFVDSQVRRSRSSIQSTQESLSFGVEDGRVSRESRYRFSSRRMTILPLSVVLGFVHPHPSPRPSTSLKILSRFRLVPASPGTLSRVTRRPYHIPHPVLIGGRVTHATERSLVYQLRCPLHSKTRKT